MLDDREERPRRILPRRPDPPTRVTADHLYGDCIAVLVVAGMLWCLIYLAEHWP